MNKKLSAKDLIAAKTNSLPVPNAEAVRELKALCEHNDRAGHNYARVSADAAREMLASHGFVCALGVLSRVCRTCLGRKSYAKP